MKTNLLLVSLVLGFAGLTAQAQEMSTPITGAQELACRTKAKDAAIQAFKGCMVESKSGQIEQIRKDFQEKLSKMKAEYELELGKISGKKSAKAETPKNEGSQKIDVPGGPRIEIKTEAPAKEESKVWTGDFSQAAPKKTLPQGKTLGKAVLFSDSEELPEPIPVENLGTSGSFQGTN